MIRKQTWWCKRVREDVHRDIMNINSFNPRLQTSVQTVSEWGSTVHIVSNMSSSLSKLTILGYGLGHVCNDICASMWFTYLLLFFQKVLIINSRVRSDHSLSNLTWIIMFCNFSSLSFLYAQCAPSKPSLEDILLALYFNRAICWFGWELTFGNKQ